MLPALGTAVLPALPTAWEQKWWSQQISSYARFCHGYSVITGLFLPGLYCPLVDSKTIHTSVLLRIQTPKEPLMQALSSKRGYSHADPGRRPSSPLSGHRALPPFTENTPLRLEEQK